MQPEQEERYTHPLPEPKNQHWLTPFAVGSLIVIFCYIVLMAYVVPLFQDKYNNWHFGDSRISSLDANINGRHDHFIAEVVHSRVIIIDMRGGDASKTVVFVSPQTPSSDKALVTLSTADVNNDGRTDIVIHVEDVGMDAVLFSVKDTFEWSVPK